MVSFLARRLGFAVVTLFSVLTLVFLIVRILPGDPVLVTSDYGYGNASYQGVYQIFLPLARK